MNWIGRRQPLSPIGLDLGARRVKAIQLRASSATPSGWRVVAAASINRTSPETPVTSAEIARVADTLDRLGFIGNRVVIAAPADKLISTMLELPKSGQIPLEQIARVELARTNKIAPESFEMGCWELPVAARAAKSAHVMAVGYTHADANAWIDIVEAGGLEVTALDTRSCLLARSCAGIAAAPPAITAMLDLGWASASLVLVYGGTLVYVRTLAEAGLNGVYDGLENRLKLEPELIDYLLAEVGLCTGPTDGTERLSLPDEARGVLSTYADGLVRELLGAFSYVARQYTDANVTRLMLTGAGAMVPGMSDHLANVLGIEASPAAPKDLAECPTGLLETCSSAELTPAFGLAMFPDT